MSKKNIIIVLAFLILVLLAGYYYYYKNKQASEVVNQTNSAVLPSTSTNPLENKPNVNPVDQTNPFKNIKTNPFQ